MSTSKKTSSSRKAKPFAKPGNLAENRSEIILLAVTGMSPAVLTETVWALAHEPEPVIPHRVVVVTTTEGRAQIQRQLFSPLPHFGSRCGWEVLRESLRLQGHSLDGRLRFGITGDDIRVITAADPKTGQSLELSDIRSPRDNESAADFLLDQVRAVTENPDTQLVASMAGGRKTMGALLYACLTLAGRETDRLTHVLVNEPYDTLPGFLFPGQPGGTVTDRAGKNWEPDNARVELAEVTFVPLRNLFVRELGRKAGTFTRLVETCRENIRTRAGERVQLSVDVSRTEIEVNGVHLRLAPMEHLLMLFLARRAKQGEPSFGAYEEAVAGINAFRAKLLAEIPKNNFGDWRHADSLRADWDEQEIRKAVSGIRAKLRQAGGEAVHLALCLPQKGRCSLDVPCPLIFLKG